MKYIYMAPCGIGLGHAARSVAIAKELVKRGYEVIFSTYSDAIEYIRRHGFDVLECYKLEYAHREDGGIDIEGTIAQGLKSLYIFFRQIGAELYYTGVISPDIVVSDSRLSSSIAAVIRGIPSILIINQLLIVLPLGEKRKSERVKKAKSFMEKLILEIMAEIWKRSDKIVVPDFPPPYTISKQNLVFNDDLANKVVLTGPLIQKRPEELPSREEIRERLGINEDKPLVLASLSGTQVEKRTLAEKLINLLSNIKLDVVAYISIGDPSSNEKAYWINDRIYVTPWLDNKYEVLKAADLLICHGGHTTLAEAMYYGVPMLIIPSITHTERRGNAQSMVELGIAKVIYQEELTANSLREALTSMLRDEELKENARRIAKEVSKFDSVKNVVDIILSIRR